MRVLYVKLPNIATLCSLATTSLISNAFVSQTRPMSLNTSTMRCGPRFVPVQGSTLCSSGLSRSERLTEGIFRRRRTTRGESAARHLLLPRARLQELRLPEASRPRRARVSDRHIGNGGDGCLSCPVPLPLAHHAHPGDRSGARPDHSLHPPVMRLPPRSCVTKNTA